MIFKTNHFSGNEFPKLIQNKVIITLEIIACMLDSLLIMFFLAEE